MARKNPADAAKAKAQKQKKLAIGLGVVLALAMAYAVHTMMSLNGGGSSSAKPQAAVETSAPAAPVPSGSATPTALPSAPSLSGAASSPSGATSSALSTKLVNAVQAPPAAGQLQSFSLFESKDPFNAGGPTATPGGGSGGGSSSGGGGGGGGTAKPPKTPPAPPSAPPLSAVISVNGVAESVSTGANFPASNPMFQLVSLTETTAKVSVAGGSYANGAATLTLKVNKPVTLVNTADGTRYTLTLQPQGTTVSAPPTTTTPTTTTPTTTTSG